ncbi:putative A/G-specific adenine glycosylase YfhQ [Planctomycetes bacterium Pan216]|uniref:Adenine DNA glycosylase n=1 Tax=Kolteria novifilia TaxID=2527975 RepID=A0A518B506_9BACT|nr:putative A/G-specific adenine glycosylase YfhQ [Planctomycetes bacterium Pan216]
MNAETWLAAADLPHFRRALLRWYRKHGRDLPWRESSSAYHVWVSEVMLQQTTVATVERRFHEFLSRFPDIDSLACASEADVLHAWQGLGYYRRARFLHQAAKRILEEHDGVMPSDPKTIRALPGLGRYTANAIASFAFGARVPILEANTLRVWSRICAMRGDPTKPPVSNDLWHVAEEALPRKEPGDFNQALMDLGATICTPREASCDRCPVSTHCRAHEEGLVERFPELPEKRAQENVDHVSVVIWHHRKVLISKRPETGPWANLWEFPRVERTDAENWTDAAWRAIRTYCAGQATLGAERKAIRHGIMHYRVHLKCFDVLLNEGTRLPDESTRWVEPEALTKLPFSSPQRRLVASVQESPSFQGTLLDESRKR